MSKANLVRKTAFIGATRCLSVWVGSLISWCDFEFMTTLHSILLDEFCVKSHWIGISIRNEMLNTTIPFLPPATKLGQGYVFTGVCDSVHRGVSASVHAGIPPTRPNTPWSRHPPRADTPGADPPGSRHPPEQTPPQSRHPPGVDTPWCKACWEIWSTCGRYASYWNANLLFEFSLPDWKVTRAY